MVTSVPRSALITGSGQNIGRAIALELAQRGINVAINGSVNRKNCQKVADEIKAAGGNATVVMGDISERDSVQAIFDKTLDAFGTVDILINNAAIRPNFNFLEDTEEHWDTIFNTNFKSGFWLSRLCLPGMLDNSWGRIIYFSGMNAQQGYPSNIISPGTIIGEAGNGLTDERYNALKEANPSGRLGTPGDIASTVGFLVADDAGFINGQLFQVNGGVVV